MPIGVYSLDLGVDSVLPKTPGCWADSPKEILGSVSVRTERVMLQ